MGLAASQVVAGSCCLQPPAQVCRSYSTSLLLAGSCPRSVWRLGPRHAILVLGAWLDKVEAAFVFFSACRNTCHALRNRAAATKVSGNSSVCKFSEACVIFVA